MQHHFSRSGIASIAVLMGASLFLTACQSQSTVPIAPPQTQTTQTTAPAAQTAKNAVTIQNFAFSPDSITIKVGDSIVWTNQDTAPHTATADDGSFDTGNLSTGQSKSISFSKAGTFTYHCGVHPSMKATVIVLP